MHPIAGFRLHLSGGSEPSHSVHLYGRQNGHGIYQGVLVFIPDGAGASKMVVATEQGSPRHLARWARSLTPAFCEEALRHAVDIQPLYPLEARGEAISP